MEPPTKVARTEMYESALALAQAQEDAEEFRKRLEEREADLDRLSARYKELDARYSEARALLDARGPPDGDSFERIHDDFVRAVSSMVADKWDRLQSETRASVKKWCVTLDSGALVPLPDEAQDGVQSCVDAMTSGGLLTVDKWLMYRRTHNGGSYEYHIRARRATMLDAPRVVQVNASTETVRDVVLTDCGADVDALMNEATYPLHDESGFVFQDLYDRMGRQQPDTQNTEAVHSSVRHERGQPSFQKGGRATLPGRCVSKHVRFVQGARAAVPVEMRWERLQVLLVQRRQSLGHTWYEGVAPLPHVPPRDAEPLGMGERVLERRDPVVEVEVHVRRVAGVHQICTSFW